MANNVESNFNRKIMETFLDGFESSRNITKNVDTQLFQGRFNPTTGDTIDVKRPHDYVTTRTSNGDVSSATPSDIISGKASAVVQDYFTVFVDYDEADEAIKLNQLDKILSPMSSRIVTDFELDFASFMMKNSGLQSGTAGTAITTWDHVAEAGAMMDASGIPKDGMWNMAVNPFTQIKLASNQRSLGTNPEVTQANEKAVISDSFAGMRVRTANTLASYTTGSEADRAGTLSASPVATYLGAKDTMTQVLAVTAIGAGSTVIKAGETVKITAASGAVNRLNLSTRSQIVDDAGAPIVWTGVVTEDVTLSGGAGNITVTGPAIYEAAGQYNTVSQAPVSGDVVTLLGSASTLIQPALFWHKQAFTCASVPIKKLKATDTVATTKDGLQFRVTHDSGFYENEQKVRIDFRPAYGVLNPFFAGQAFG